MKKRIDKRRAELEEEERVFQQYCDDFPANATTDRGQPFWYNHAAKPLLTVDGKGGLADTLLPGELHKTREEYMKFSPSTFRQRVYQEKSRQRAAPYWRKKRNVAVAAQQKHDKRQRSDEGDEASFNGWMTTG